MALKHLGYVELPAHAKPGGFDHAAIHRRTSRIYVAHTANDSLDVIDGASDSYLRSIPNLAEVAGAPIESIAKEIKAVTYHNLAVRETARGLETTIVFDV